MSSGAQLVPAAFTGCAPRKLLVLSLYGHTVVPRLKTVESHVIVPTSTPSNVARAPKRRSTSTPFPVMADGFDGMEMNVRTPAPFVVRTPVPLFLTVNPPTSSAVPSKPKSRPTPLFSITNVPTPLGLMILPAPTRIPRGLFVMAMVLSLKTFRMESPSRIPPPPFASIVNVLPREPAKLKTASWLLLPATSPTPPFLLASTCAPRISRIDVPLITAPGLHQESVTVLTTE